MAEANLSKAESIVVIACEVMKSELEMVSGCGTEFHFLDQGLHRTPKKMAGLVQEKIDLVGKSADRVVIGYGLCSGGIIGIRGRSCGLVVPSCHDCIAMFFGSQEAYRQRFAARPGTYYLTAGWVKAKKDPLGIIYDDYAPKHGLETAFWVMEEELKHYTHIALVDTGVGDLEFLRMRTHENCEVLKKEYMEVQGSLDYFRKLIYGPYDGDDFLRLSSGEEVTEEMFLGLTR
ncbi:MAG: DUF1638 domain-containing protein [Desulfomonilaceae bacterium]